jgi:SAM-dependent methyltransferase
MTARQWTRSLLDSAGLLDSVREARDAVRGVPWWRANARFWRHGADDGWPLPPLRLVRASTGTSSLEWMLEGGRLAAGSISEILARQGRTLEDSPRVLDFGCGCGRVIRRWAHLDIALHGCDYNASAIRWCRRHLTFARFETNGLTPPFPYGDGEFDLVYALSVFTHLPEPLLFDWMREVRRVLVPHGLLVLSTHGDAYLSQLTLEEQAAFRAGHAVVRDDRSAGTNRCGVYMSEAFIRTRMADGFRVLDVVPQGARGNPPQDLALLQRER